MTFNRQELAEQSASLAVQGVYIGTSSWKYPGWCGTLYDPARYEYRGKFAESRFKKNCLAEYAEVFKTVCVDAAYYTFPSQQYLEGLTMQTPDDFLFGFKVTDTITIKKFSKLDRFGEQAGTRHQVTHVFNSWEAMPSVAEQMALPGNRTNPDLTAARFLLKPGRKYEQAVKAFEPYDRLKEENPEARAAGRALIAEGQAAGPKRRTFVYVNNRLEGNAVATIAAVMSPA